MRLASARDLGQRASRALEPRRSVALACAALVVLDLATRASFLAPRLVTLRGALNYLAAIVALAIVLRLLAATQGLRRVVLHAIFVALPMGVQAALFHAYGEFVEPTDFVAFADSPGVAFHAAGVTADFVASLGIALGALLAVRLLPRDARPLRWPLLVPSVAALGGAITAGAIYWRACPTLEHPVPAFAASLGGILRRAAVRSTAGARPTVPPQPTRERLPNVVLVVGESLAASHLPFYGYPLDTAPRLGALNAQGKLLPVRDATVMGPNTRSSVPYILTGLAGPDPGGRVYAAPTVLEYAKARGYHTAFVSAQEESWGSFDVLFREGVDVFHSGIDYAPEVDVLKGADDLDVLERGVLPTLANLPEPFFVVLHMDGSHAPYGRHSPPSRKVFAEDGINSVEAYDNTIRVTDEYLARVLDALRARDPQAWMFFTSDHGQALGEGGAFFNHGYQSNVVRDPLLLFPPPSADQEQWRAIAETPASACDLVPTLLHLMGAKAVAPMDCADWLAGPSPQRVRVVSAYTPTYVGEPTMLVLLPDGHREVFDLGRGTVVMDDGSLRGAGEVAIPREVDARLR